MGLNVQNLYKIICILYFGGDDTGKIARKGLVTAVVAIFFGLALMPAIGEANFILKDTEWNGDEKSIEIEVTEYKSDGSTEKRIVILKQNVANDMKEELINAKTTEERLSILKKYNLISKEITSEKLKEGMYERAKEIGFIKKEIQKIAPPVLISFFNRVDAVYFFGNSLRIGLSPIIDLLYLIAGWGMKKIDFIDMCWGMFGVVSTSGILTSHAFVGMPSIMCLAGFVGYSIKFPLTMHIFTGYSVMTFAVGLGIHDVSFLPWLPR